MDPLSALRNRFPADFRFGIGDADLQVIGEKHTLAHEDSQPTMWGTFSKRSGKVYKNETPDLGIDRYHRWEEDIGLLKTLGFRNYRTSISWSRLLHQSGQVNEKAVTWYRTYFKGLRAEGIQVYATLYHWELPHSLHEEGGWKNRSIIEKFTSHALAAVDQFKDLVDEFFILNEPWCSAHNSYFNGTHAPGESNLYDTLIASHHLLLAQAAAFRAIRGRHPEVRVGSVVNIEPSFPLTETAENQQASKYAHQYFNGWFLDPMFLGKYPTALSKLYGEMLPEFSAEDMQAIKIGPELSSLGINYYQSKVVEASSTSPLGYSALRLPGEETNGLGWSISVPPIYPKGLFEGLKKICADYPDLPSIYISENGYAGDGKEDPERISYYQRHLDQVAEAVELGLPINAYFAWTLMDNYEWAEGYQDDSRFGLYHVDRETMERTPKNSAKWWEKFLSNKKAAP